MDVHLRRNGKPFVRLPRSAPEKQIALCEVTSATAPEFRNAFGAAVIEGLARQQKSLPCQYFYDANGSALFEAITQLPEYYPTRTELRILQSFAPEILSDAEDHGVLVEFGSGSSLKTEILIGLMPETTIYMPIDVSPSALQDARDRLRQRFCHLDIRPVVGDFGASFHFADDLASARKIGFFPGSTIGNFAPDAARDLLAGFRSALAPSGRLIVGVDLKKDPQTLVRAYNDAAGVTGKFNLNLLLRINRELGGGFRLDRFSHMACYNSVHGRIEMHLVSEQEQVVAVGGARFYFRQGETIHTENSHKYTIEEFRHLAGLAGWAPGRVWVDEDKLFSVHELVAN